VKTAGRTLVAMSGGVDSSVAAALLVEQGHDVVGVTMKTFCYSETPSHGKTCCGLDGISDARRVADRLGIPHYVFDVEDTFTRDVIDDFVSEYARGRTPNPCVRCNSNTKFSELLRRGELLGCERVASGHYVRVEHGPSGSTLLRGRDHKKDQAYFLWGLPGALLPKLRFPLGELTKLEVREKARALGLVTADKPESQEICFVPTGDYRDLLKRRLPERHAALEPGDIVTEDGALVGRHDGYAGFTVGQRKGLGGGFAEPMHVIEVRPDRREVVVGPLASLDAAGVVIDGLNWHTPPRAGESVSVQMRHRAPAVAAEVVATPDGWTGSSATVLTLSFEEPQRAVTPGQSAVVFRGEQVLGGGRIRSALRGAASLP
jgi:tRNA-specific 2-thiouridylase